jgi:AraC-like DNA-binding protein
MIQPTRIFMSSECSHLTVRIRRQALEQRVAEALGQRLSAPLQFCHVISSTSDFGRTWLQLLGHICDVSANAPTILASAGVRRQYSRTLMELLVHSATHNYSHALDRCDRQAVPRYVRRAREYMRSHVTKVRSVAQVAGALGISPRTLQLGFRHSFNVTPVEYLRDIRIQALHEALLGAAPGQNVTDVMQSVGIVNFSRYAQYYRRKIGVAPSATLRCGA